MVTEQISPSEFKNFCDERCKILRAGEPKVTRETLYGCPIEEEVLVVSMPEDIFNKIEKHRKEKQNQTQRAEGTGDSNSINREDPEDSR